jgi:hypothetical protein
MFCNQSNIYTITHSHIEISINNVIYSFNKKSIPISAMFTKNYREFREILIEYLTEVKFQINTLVNKFELENNILKTQPDMQERNKVEIRNYITKLNVEIEWLMQLRDELQTLKDNEKLMKKIFHKIHGNVHRK